MHYPIDAKRLMEAFSRSRPGVIFDADSAVLVEILVEKINDAYEQGLQDARRKIYG